MSTDLEQLARLLRMELTAVHQQFFHMLALRQWKNRELLGRITEVDSEDFRNAMQIIELLVSRDFPIALDSQQVLPGSDVPSILRSESRLEEEFAGVLAATQVAEAEAVARVDRAAAPRQAYREWLARQIAGVTPANTGSETKPSMAELLAHLTALVEQAMLHAFLLRRLGRHGRADNAWRLSGAAMLYVTALVRRGAAMKAVPTPAPVSPVRMAAGPAEAFDADIFSVGRCAALARRAAEDADDDASAGLSRRIADDCDLIAGMEPDQDFAATFGRSPVFESFAATRDKFLA